MKVNKLIEILSKCNPDDDVVFAFPKGDYWRTTMTSVVREANYDEVEADGTLRNHDRKWDYESPLTRVVVIK